MKAVLPKLALPTGFRTPVRRKPWWRWPSLSAVNNDSLRTAPARVPFQAPACPTGSQSPAFATAPPDFLVSAGAGVVGGGLLLVVLACVGGGAAKVGGGPPLLVPVGVGGGTEGAVVRAVFPPTAGVGSHSGHPPP